MLMPGLYNNNSIFDNFFNDDWFNTKELDNVEKKLYGHRAKNMMNTDIKETEDSFEMEMELPGFKKEEVTVELNNGYLIINANRNMDENETEHKIGKYIRRERYAGSCQRTFYVGENITQEDIKARFKHGILKLSIPKKTEKEIEKNKYISIEG